MAWLALMAYTVMKYCVLLWCPNISPVLITNVFFTYLAQNKCEKSYKKKEIISVKSFVKFFLNFF